MSSNNVGELHGFERSQITFTHLGKTALGGPVVWSPMLSREADYLDQTEAARDKILSLPTNAQGIDIGRIHRYRRQMGGPQRPLLFLNPSIFEEATLILLGKPDETDMGDNRGDVYGRYSADLCMVKRDPVMEELNGSAWTESIAIHEMAHGTATMSPIQIIAKKEGRLLKRSRPHAYRRRMGFIVGKNGSEKSYDRGEYLEEGYAEYERGQYVKQIGNPDGVLNQDPRLLEEFEGRTLGPHYWWLSDEEDRTITSPLRSSIPAATLEAFIKVDPLLLPALRRSRHSADGLREVAQRINNFQPGLYRKLQKFDLQTREGLMEAARFSGELVQTLRDSVT